MSDQPHYIGHRKRLKERFRQDRSSLADYELLELLLAYGLPRRDTKPLAKDLLQRFGSLKGVFTARQEELREVEGFGPGLETFWGVWQEFWARLQESPLRRKEMLCTPGTVAEMACSRIGHQPVESFWAALVDNKNRLISFVQVSQGTVDQALVYSREIMALALKWQASGVILIHNHPGGDPTPSVQDKDLTRRVQKAAGEIGLRVLDHVVVAEESYYSFQERGLL
ncbi:RadC family protein [Desulfovermiculus halophilus]|jgi:DNA repair protein RadC|uniref:RadC family protein n=1 Tax=Desulfovermiculus halophilus TaxID=339722 RepID=UPI000486E53A|nr:DNA repair protein RadC [Desulfovermiculus halophilus]